MVLEEAAEEYLDREKTNHELLIMTNTGRKLMQTIRKSQLKFSEHLMRENGWKISLQLERLRERSKREAKTDFYHKLACDMKDITSAKELMQATRDRKVWRSMVTNVATQST